MLLPHRDTWEFLQYRTASLRPILGNSNLRPMPGYMKFQPVVKGGMPCHT